MLFNRRQETLRALITLWCADIVTPGRIEGGTDLLALRQPLREEFSFQRDRDSGPAFLCAHDCVRLRESADRFAPDRTPGYEILARNEERGPISEALPDRYQRLHVFLKRRVHLRDVCSGCDYGRPRKSLPRGGAGCGPPGSSSLHARQDRAANPGAGAELTGTPLGQAAYAMSPA